jgi:ATP-dependent RNA helicase RhlE
VINFELPNVPETYVHRIGRTGRAGASGISISFCDAEEKAYLKDIHKLIGKTIPVIDDHDYPLTNHNPTPSLNNQRQGNRPRTNSNSRPNNNSRPNSSSRSKDSRPSNSRPNSSRPNVSSRSNGRSSVRNSGRKWSSDSEMNKNY